MKQLVLKSNAFKRAAVEKEEEMISSGVNQFT